MSVLMKDFFFFLVPVEVSMDIFNQGSLGSDSDDRHDFLFEGISGNGISFQASHCQISLLSLLSINS